MADYVQRRYSRTGDEAIGLILGRGPGAKCRVRFLVLHVWVVALIAFFDSQINMQDREGNSYYTPSTMTPLMVP
jgi:hypothetical protein